MPVRLGAFSVGDAYPEGERSRDRFAELLDLVQAADRGGLSSFWVAEHHFHPGGLCPSPPVFLAAAGQRARRIRLGSLVSVLPFHNPVDVAEEYALLDQLLDGRLNFGIGSGYIPLEFEGFGVDPGSKRERFDRSLSTILAAFHGEEVQSAPGGARVRINVTPRQKPHPPITIAVQRREALPFVAQKGAGVALIPYATVSGLEELAEEIREFRSSLPSGVSAPARVALHIYAGERPAAARRALQNYLDSRLATQSTFYQEKVRRDPRHANAKAVEASGFAVIGSPAEVRAALGRFEEVGVDELLGIFDFGGLSRTEVEGSIKSLGKLWTEKKG